jgi:ATP-dependent Clp protease ATP-binding subunit ClpA
MFERIVGYFAEEMVGQPEAITAFARAAVRAKDGHLRGNRPLFVLLIAGPAGSGKRYLMESLARLVLGSEHRVIRMNPTFYDQVEPCLSFLAAQCAAFDATLPPGANPVRLVYVEPLEKAPAPIIDLFSHIFGTGAALVGPNFAVDFRRTIFVLETSLAEFEQDDGPVGFQAADPEALARVDARNRQAIKDRIYAGFPSRLLALIDEIAFFRKIREVDLPFILDKFLRHLQRQLLTRGLHLHVEDSARSFLLQQGCKSLRFGAKELRHAADLYLESPILDLISSRPLPPGSVIYARRSLEGVSLFVPVA